jgi:ribose transport system permease protein
MNQPTALSIFTRRNRDVILSLAVLLVVFVLFAYNQKDFFTKYGPQSIFNQVITLCVVAFGQFLVVLIGGIDLSVGAMVAVCNCFIAQVMAPMVEKTGGQLQGILLTVLLCLCAGGLLGMLNGFVVILGRIQPIVVTLATSMVFSGVALIIRPTPGGDVTRAYCRFLTGRVFDYIPMGAIVLCALVFIIWPPFRRTRLCQNMYAVGGNEYSAFASGIGINFTKFMAYTLCGVACGAAAVMLTASTASGDATGSSGYTINSVAAVVLGGSSLTGGKGSYIGAAAGAMIMSLILGILIFWGISSWYQSAAQGLILVAALSAGRLRDVRRAKSVTLPD